MKMRPNAQYIVVFPAVILMVAKNVALFKHNLGVNTFSHG